MAINVATSFNVQTNLPIDERFKFETIEEMKSMNPNLLYEGVLSYNIETGKYYTYSEDNSEEETLGKWREFSSGSDIIYFNSWEEWEGARIAGELDPDKYYAYPQKAQVGPDVEPGSTIIYFANEDSYKAAKESGNLEEDKYYAYVGGFAKGSNIILDSSNSITYFDTYNEWLAAKEAGELDPEKFYSYPTYGITEAPKPIIELPEAEMRVEFSDGSVKNYIIYCKEE